jgi:hypothetical protein
VNEPPFKYAIVESKKSVSHREFEIRIKVGENEFENIHIFTVVHYPSDSEWHIREYKFRSHKIDKHLLDILNFIIANGDKLYLEFQ